MTELEILTYAVTAAAEGGAFNTTFVIKHALNLLILIGIIVYFARIPIKRALEKRKANMSREIDEAKHSIEVAKQQYEEYKEKIKGLEGEVNELKESISKLGETEKDEIISQARHTCELIKKDSKDTIELEAFRAKQEIQEEVVNSSLEIASRLIKEQIGDSYNTKAVDKLISQIEEGKWLQ